MLDAKNLALLAKARELRGLSQADLGKRLGLTRLTINRIERGHRPLKPPLLEAWCKAVGVECRLIAKLSIS